MTTIGNIPFHRIMESAKSYEAIGGAPVPHTARALRDLAICDASTIFTVTRNLSQGHGGLLMSSGGTTGAPKLTLNPFHQACDRLISEWDPLASSDVMLNLFTPGRLWASHYYMQQLAAVSRAVIAPTGPYEIDDISNWMDIFDQVGVNALAGTPTGLHEFALGVQRSDRVLPIRKIIWMAEPWVDGKRDVVRQQFPEAQFWGNYGSVETYVIGTNTPACEPDTLHLMGDQILEIDDEGVLLTRVGDGWTVPVIRYRIKDRLHPASCRCGRGAAFRVSGRSDDSVLLRSTMFSVNELLSVALGIEGVSEAQLICNPEDDNPKAATALTINYVGTPSPDDVMNKIASYFYDLPTILRVFPDAFRAVNVSSLTYNSRTQKIPPLIWERV